jgi:hypothetical protein
MASQAPTSWVRLGAWTRLGPLDGERAEILNAFPAFRRARSLGPPSHTPDLTLTLWLEGFREERGGRTKG